MSAPVRTPDFYDRFPTPDGDQGLRCRECGFSFAHIPDDWLDRHVGERVPCPECALNSRIPTPEEGLSDHNVPGSGLPRAVDDFPVNR